MMKINEYIDHTVLNADARKSDIDKLVKEAQKYKFKSVCVNSSYVSYIRKIDKNIKITSVVGFPLGAMATKAKAYEAKLAISDGADEIDMVINVGRLKDKDYSYVEKDIEEVKKSCQGKVLKVIIETCLLTDQEKIKACEISKKAGADFVKTSTGFSKSGAKIEDVKLMRESVGENFGVKASGGIHNKDQALQMIKAGANRLGTSKSIEIVEG